MDKQLVRYSTLVSLEVCVGKSAIVVVTEHPDKTKEGQVCVTGGVVDIVHIINDDRPVFATVDTLYTPERRLSPQSTIGAPSHV